MNGDKSICGMELYSEDDLKRLARQAKDLVPQHDSSSSDIT